MDQIIKSYQIISNPFVQNIKGRIITCIKATYQEFLHHCQSSHQHWLLGLYFPAWCWVAINLSCENHAVSGFWIVILISGIWWICTGYQETWFCSNVTIFCALYNDDQSHTSTNHQHVYAGCLKVVAASSEFSMTTRRFFMPRKKRFGLSWRTNLRPPRKTTATSCQCAWCQKCCRVCWAFIIYDPVPLLNIFEQSYQSALMLSLCKCACHTYIYTHKLQMRVTHTSYPESNFLRLMPVTCQDLQRPGVAESCLGSSETLYSKVPTSPEVVPTGSNREIRLDKSEKRQHAWHFQI